MLQKPLTIPNSNFTAKYTVTKQLCAIDSEPDIEDAHTGKPESDVLQHFVHYFMMNIIVRETNRHVNQVIICSFRQSFTTNVNYLKRRFSSGDLSSECEDGDAPVDPYTKPPVTAQPQAPPPPPPSQSSTASDLSLNLRAGSKTTSAPSSPAKSRESLLQRVQSLTGQARDQGASILGAAVSSATRVTSVVSRACTSKDSHLRHYKTEENIWLSSVWNV
ncbi:hypothetical protein JTB14_033990 [Gonioctena quinquepunctata]|nr:hypothetical protein JTB14_033990 [Gonioctena quinquepunctata]